MSAHRPLLALLSILVFTHAARADLDADRSRMIAEAKADLGPRIDVAVADDVWVFIGPPGHTGAPFRSSVSFAKDVLSRLLDGRFDKRPQRPVAVYLFGSAGPYTAYCKAQWSEPCVSVYGFYVGDSRKLVMNVGPGLGTLSHELVHPMMAADFPDAPSWINEGIASLFEAVVLGPDGSIHGAKNWRYPILRAALDSPAKRAEASLDTLFSLDTDRFRDAQESLHYALARYFCQWMDARGELWPFYRTWRDRRADDPSGRETFAQITGMTVPEATPLFARWVRRL